MESDSMEADSTEADSTESDSTESDSLTIEHLPRLSTLCSPNLVKFVIGPSKKEYYLHKPLVASLSKSIHSLLSAHENTDGADTVDWSDQIDQDIFHMFVQYAYTGGYKIPTRWLSHNYEEKVLHRHRKYSEARSNNPHAYSIYESSLYVETPCPTSLCRRHAHVWAFAATFDIPGLEKFASDDLRSSLKIMMQEPTGSDSYLGSYLDLEERSCREVVDVIGYVYHQGCRLWGSEIQVLLAPLSGVKLTVVRFARKYICDSIDDWRAGRHTPEYRERNYRKVEMWADLLEKEPQIAVDLDCLYTIR